MKLKLTAPRVRRDPYPTYAYLREHDPVQRADRPLIGRVWYLSRYEDVTSAFRDPRLVNSRESVGDGKGRPKWFPKSFMPFVESMITSDGEDHRRLRALVQVAFTPRRIEALRGSVEAVIDERLEILAAHSRRGEAELIEDFALPVPLRIISEMMGVHEREQRGFHTLTNRFMESCVEVEAEVAMELADKGMPGLFLGARNTLKLLAFLRRQVAEKRANPGPDLVSALLSAEADGERLTVEEVAGMIFLLLLAGHETTVNLLGNGVLALLDNPDELAKLRDDPSLIDGAVEELLRFANPVAQVSPRFAREDFELRGRRIRRGDLVMPLIAAANRDPRAFERADQLDITRSPNRHVAFGLGVHYCLGSPLARMEGKLAINALLRRFPEIELRAPRDRLRWRRSTLIRGLQALPLRLA